jgi:zinc protease
VAYRVPEYKSEDTPAIELLTTILGQGESSRINNVVVRDKKLAQAAIVLTNPAAPRRGPGVLLALGIANQGITPDSLERGLSEEFARVVREGVSESELAKAKNGYRTQLITQQQQTLAKAEAIQAANLFLGAPDAVNTNWRRFLSVTVADIKRVAGTYLRPENALVLLIYAGSRTVNPLRRSGASALVLLAAAAPLAAQDYPKTPPTPGPLTPAPFPPFRETVLPNGLRILVVESHKQPIVSLSLSFAAGSIFDPAGKEGLSEMVAGLLTKGAGTRTAEQISETIEGAGGSLSAGAGPDFLSINSTVLTSSLPLAMELIGDAAVRPAFPATEVELLRTQTLSGLQVALSQPESVADRIFQRTLYGKNPYGRSADPASVKATTRADLVAFQRSRLKPAGALLVVAGDVTLPQVRALALKAFRGWVGAPRPFRSSRRPHRAPGPS